MATSQRVKLKAEDFPGLTSEQLETLEAMAVKAGQELRRYTANKHSHVTRDIKPRGSGCLACEAYWIRHEVLSAPAQVCPECRDGKHGNCIGYALNPDTDVVGECECTHTG